MPTAFLTIVVNSGSEDQLFNLKVLDNQLTPGFPQDIAISTVNGTESQTLRLNLSIVNQYYATETVPEEWKLNSVVCISDDSGTASESAENGVLLTLATSSNTTCTFNNEKQHSQVPVLFIPGTVGTEIFKGAEKLWPDATKMVLTNNDRFMDPLAFKDDATPLDTSLSLGQVVSIERSFDYTDGLKQTFASQNYIENEKLFLFPYDWRDDIVKNANTYLKQKIDNIFANPNVSQLDIVAHSQGGLLIKRLLYDHPEYQAKIRKLVLLGVPNLGSPKSAKALLYGDTMGVELGPLGLDPGEIKRIAPNMPAVYQMLPSKEYFNHSSGYFGTFEVPWFKDPKITLYDYQTTKDKLKADGYNSTLLDSAETFHTAAYDNFDFSTTGIDAYNIMGCKSPTIKSMLVRKWGEDKVEYGPGDGTVPIISASNTIGTQNFYILKNDDLHGKMPSFDGIRQKVVNIITGSNLSTPNITNNPTECTFNGKQVSVHSPVELHIYDSAGNHFGPMPDGSFESNIPGVAYDIIGEQKFAFLPAGQTFTIKLIALDAGTFSFNASIIQNGQTTSTAHYDSIPITAASTAEIITNTQNNQTINFTSDSRVIQPSAILNANQSLDAIPPTATSTITGTLNSNGSYSGSVSISLSASDAVIPGAENQTSGLLNIQYNLDNQGYQIYSTSTPIAVSASGSHSLQFFSGDNAGNSETPQTINFNIAEPAPASNPASNSGSGGVYYLLPPTESISQPKPATEPKPEVLGAITEPPKHPEGSLIVYSDHTVYLIVGNAKHPFFSAEQFLIAGYYFENVSVAWPGDALIFLGMPVGWK